MQYLKNGQGESMTWDPRRKLEDHESPGKYDAGTSEYRKWWNGDYWVSSGSGRVYHPVTRRSA